LNDEPGEQNDMGKLDGKVAIVTGAGGGLGRCHALGLAAEGAKVVVNDLGGQRDGTGEGHSMADGVVAQIKAAGGQAVAHYGSVTAAADAADMVAFAVKSFGRLDILVNNAGILRDRTFKKMTHEEWDAVINVHLRGTYLVTRAAWDQMLAQGQGGRIINTSSTSGLIGNFGQANYGAAKAGIAGFTRVLALEGMKAGITVNTLAPAAWSRMTEDIMQEGQAERFAPEKVSPVVVWLCTDEARDVTGRQFCVGGNRISLLSWQVLTIGEHDPRGKPWTVDEVDAAMKSTREQWPRLLKPMEV
jgi:NAD(P)-dependent dehydrogenase (short-subunit alcohol dehydrogenase family)